jgi:hypothetical protein
MPIKWPRRPNEAGFIFGRSSEVVPLSPAERAVIPVALVEGRLFSKRDHEFESPLLQWRVSNELFWR